MFVDAAALIAILSGETEAERCANALASGLAAFTSPIAVWEAVVALARADKFGDFDLAATAVQQLMERRGVELRQLPEPGEAFTLSVDAARRYGKGSRRLNLADCFHYACARHYDAAILSTADEFRFTDLATVP